MGGLSCIPIGPVPSQTCVLVAGMHLAFELRIVGASRRQRAVGSFLGEWPTCGKKFYRMTWSIMTLPGLDPV